MKEKNTLKYIAIYIFLILLRLLTIILIINMIIILKSNNYIYNNIENIPKSQAVMVLGAYVYNNGLLSDVLQDRIDTALILYNKNKVEKFILSGDHGKKNYDEVNTMKNYLLSKGVNPKDIFLDHAGFETYDSIYRAKKIFCIKSMIITTQNFHLNRAVFTGNILGIKAYGFPADRRNYLYINYYKKRELLARVKIFFKVLFKMNPKFLGNKIPITGNSKDSWD